MYFLGGILSPLNFCPYYIPYVMCGSCNFYLCPAKSLQKTFIYLLLITGIIGGRIFCGFLCPFGTVQEMTNDLSKGISHSADVKLKVYSIVKYTFLGVILIIAFDISGFISIPCDIWLPLTPNYLPLLFAIFIFIAAFSNRYWCQLLCPIGTILSLFNKIAFVGIKINKTKCAQPQCKFCKDVCPMDKLEPGNLNCMVCFECFSRCPSAAISLGLFKGYNLNLCRKILQILKKYLTMLLK